MTSLSTLSSSSYIGIHTYYLRYIAYPPHPSIPEAERHACMQDYSITLLIHLEFISRGFVSLTEMSQYKHIRLNTPGKISCHFYAELHKNKRTSKNIVYYKDQNNCINELWINCREYIHKDTNCCLFLQNLGIFPSLFAHISLVKGKIPLQ